MLRGAMQEKSLVADKRASFDPADCEDIERLFKKTRREKEEALMLAVLADAIECFQKYVFAANDREKKVFQEAEDWIIEKNNDWLFSFDNICEALQLTPDYVRQGLLRWKEAKSQGHPETTHRQAEDRSEALPNNQCISQKTLGKAALFVGYLTPNGNAERFQAREASTTSRSRSQE